jgi:hypothetical protein
VIIVKFEKGLAARIVGAGSLALLLSAPVFAAPQDPGAMTQYRVDRISTQGRISMISREGDRYRIRLDHGDYDYWVPASTIGSRNLRVGDPIRLNGVVNGELVNVDMVATQSEPYYMSDPYYVAVPYGTSGWMTGTVQSSNRHLGYLTIKEDRSGEFVKIDVRNMDRAHPVKVWNIRPGDRITINGAWEKRDTFNAARIEY